MILVRYKEVMSNPKLCFFTESGDLIEEENLCLKEEGYIVLVTIYRDKNWSKVKSPFRRVSYPWPKKIFRIKAKTTKRSTTIIQVVISTVLDMVPCTTHIPLPDIQSISLQQVSFLQANLCL